MNNTKNNTSLWLAHAALLGANLFYGAGFSVAKSIMPALIKPNGFILIRVVCATLLFWFSFFLGPTYRTKIQKEDWKTLILCGLFGVTINQLLFFQGLQYTTPIHASLMMLSTPILVSLFGAYVLKDKLRYTNVAGLILGVLGAGFLILQRDQQHLGSNVLLGNIYVLLNATSYSIYFIMVKPLMAKYRPIVVIRWVFLMGAFFVFPFGFKDFTEVDWSLFHWPEYGAIAFIVVGVTFFTYLWNIYALQILSPSTAGSYIYMQPLFAAVISIIFLGEDLGPMKMMAGLFIFVGVYLAVKKDK